jgi:hypothetical protein
MYALILFYHATAHWLQPTRPLQKFIAVKILIFFTFWQSVGVSLLVQYKVIIDIGSYKTADIAVAIQNYVICFELIFFALYLVCSAFPLQDIHVIEPQAAEGEIHENQTLLDHSYKQPGNYYDKYYSGTFSDTSTTTADLFQAHNDSNAAGIPRHRDSLCTRLGQVFDLRDVVADLTELSDSTGMGDVCGCLLSSLLSAVRCLCQGLHSCFPTPAAE